jgi:chaperonin cofactor prefoldin
MMTKQNLQKELKEKIKEGIKPSDLKKLKRSKSADDISSESEANALQKENSELKKQLEQTTLALSELTKIRNNTPPAPLLQEQLKEKKKEIETLREKGEDSAKQIETLREKIEKLQEQLEEQHQKLISSLEEQDLALAPSPQTNENELTELDQALIVRHKSLQD